jgi:hypothetical protein
MQQSINELMTFHKGSHMQLKYAGVHAKWVLLLQNMRDEQWQRIFIHPQHGKTFSIAYAMYAGMVITIRHILQN